MRNRDGFVGRTAMKVSVLICTRNRAQSLIRCLDSIDIAARAASLADAEIIVTDNGSEDDTSSIVRKWAPRSSVAVRLEYEPKAGITIAKNRGLRSARGEILVLTDDDCRLQSDYFVELLRLHANDAEPALRGGRVELGDEADLDLTIKTETVPKRWDLSRRSARHENLGNCFLGCNLFMTRAVYERLGPFDENFGVDGKIPSGEDTEYIFRAYAAGLKLEYAPNIVVFHHHGRQTPADARRLWHNYMIGSGGLYAKYLLRRPSLCGQIRWDLKGLFREIVTRKNLFLPEYGFSYVDKFRCYLRGATLYLSAMLKQQHSTSG
jgi:glycosyltransferase involved in cell wall biosynthesis